MTKLQETLRFHIQDLIKAKYQLGSIYSPTGSVKLLVDIFGNMNTKEWYLQTVLTQHWSS